MVEIGGGTGANLPFYGQGVGELERDRLRKAPPIVRPLIVGSALRDGSASA